MPSSSPAASESDRPRCGRLPLRGLEFMGIEVDPERNRSVTDGEGEITTDDSRVRVLVVPTNEEKTIARDVVRVLNGIMPEFTPPETIK